MMGKAVEVELKLVDSVIALGIEACWIMVIYIYIHIHIHIWMTPKYKNME